MPDPPAILAIGMNYRAHVAEMGREPPEWQYWFNKQRTAIAGPGDPIVLPVVSHMVDYEGELAMVIGRRCQHVPAARAPEVVAGYTIINDVSARDWQWRSPTFTMGKSFDTHAPCGPELVTGDELGDPGALAIRTWVNDELRQDSTTADLIFGCADMIEYLTTAFPLEPGTIIATGTPAGVGAGMDPPRFLAAGDTVRIAVEGIGELTNPSSRVGGPSRSGSAERVRGHGAPPARHNGGVPDETTVLSDAERADRLGKLQGIMDLMRPAVQADGGDLVLVRADVETGVIEVQLQGACSSCAISSATLSGGVERILRERLPWVTEVIGGIDDSLSFDESASLGSGGYVPNF